MTQEQQRSSKIMEEVGDKKEKAAMDAIHEFIHKDGKVSEKDLKIFEQETVEKLKEVVAFKRK